MAHLDQSSGPVLRTSTGLHAYQAGFAICKMLEERGPFQLPVHNLTRAGVHPVKLEYVLRNIHPYGRILHLDPPVCL